ncbi:MAG TPA: ABC transporter substrate-binding protein [Bacillota bacterium]|nr:ABC transporter substrate-binding protein [Bacillota bacterium]
MKFVKKGIWLLFLVVLLILIGCGSDETDSSEEADSETESESATTDDSTETETNDDAEEVESNGEVKIAINAQPPTLDPHMTTAGATTDVGKMMFESLLTIDSKYNPVPMLAESVDVNDDNTVFTFHLREGVLFHNGDEMTSDDVVASMNRWKEMSGVASNTLGDAEFVALDDYTVEIELEQSSGIALGVISSSEQFAAIMPKEVIESAAEDGVTEYIGTGPYEFVEWKQDQYIHYEKFADYAPVDREPDGISGKKEVFIDDVYFYVVTDTSTRLAGIQSGEYDIAYALPEDNYEQLLDNPDLDVQTVYTANMDLLYNKRGGLMQDLKMRQAVNAAINIDDILLASLVNEDLYRADASYMSVDIEQWATEIGGENYNINDAEKAQALFDEAGYDGESIILMTTRDYEHYYNASVVIKEQLEQIGINAELEVYDWPTIVDRREEDDAWDLFVNAYPFKSDPTQLLQLSPEFAGGINDEKADELLAAIRTAETPEEAVEYWEDLQEYAWTDYLPMTKLGSFGSVYAFSKNVENAKVGPGGVVIWNAKIAE